MSHIMSMSHIEGIPKAPADPIFQMTARFRADKRPIFGAKPKINLGVGAYRTEELKPYVFPSVIEAEKVLLARLESGKTNKEYLPIAGLAAFRTAAAKLVFGEDAPELPCVSSTQSISGTGALRLAACFIRKFIGKKCVYFPNPTWGNHFKVFSDAGFNSGRFRVLPYWDAASRSFAFDAYVRALEAAPDESVLIQQLCCHNPTGMDPTPEQMKAIAEVCARKKLVVVIDVAYQGFGRGLVEDRAALRTFLDAGVLPFVCQSFAKSMGLYGERVGCVHLVTSSETTAARVSSQMKVIVRRMFSNPPRHGAELATIVLNTLKLREQWESELAGVRARIRRMREEIQAAVEARGTPGDWSHFTKQQGMFCFTGLTPSQSRRMTDTHHIYMLPNGRISVAGLTSKTIPYFVECLHSTVTGLPRAKL